ncbi:MAG: phosphopantetheine-binding protein [bacterium]|nr:phosphopantetheine-binding protein [bacterium]
MKNSLIVENQLRDLMVKVWKLNMKPEEIPDREDMLEKLGVNSVDVLELLIHIEKEFNMEINDDDLNAELVNSIGSLANYIVKQRESN